MPTWQEVEDWLYAWECRHGGCDPCIGLLMAEARKKRGSN